MRNNECIVLFCTPLEATIIEICMNVMVVDLEENETLAKQIANEAGITLDELYKTIEEIVVTLPHGDGSDDADSEN